MVLEDPKLEYDFVPRLGVALGNAATYASVGGTIRIGKDLRNDFGPPRARPALPGSEGFIGEGFGWYFFVGAGGEAVARNIFLDGNTDGNSLRCTHRPFVGEAQAGIAILFTACASATRRYCARRNSSSAIAGIKSRSSTSRFAIVIRAGAPS